MGRAEDLFKRIIDGGEATIDDLIRDRQSEELFLDFKRSADNGTGRKLHDIDRANLAKAISGFGNSEGGIIVWGVDCRDLPATGDVATAKVLVDNPQRFKSWLEGAVSGCTVPAHSHVRHEAIEFARAGRGIIVTHVPKSSLAPHQVVGRTQYYIRAGSDFMPAPHGVLAGLFGRSPQPVIFHMWAVSPATLARHPATAETASFHVDFMIFNDGPTIVRDLFANVKLFPPRGGSKARVERLDAENWEAEFQFGVVVSVVSKDSYKLAPKAWAIPLRLHFQFAPPFEAELFYEITFGCNGSPVSVLSNTSAVDHLKAAYHSFVRSAGAEDQRFIRDILRLEENEVRSSDD